jgi:predicted acylesterase/phospholipase RssA
MPTDLLLSSGFLAFARHAGVLAAVEESGLDVGTVVGTSSGAVVGALWAAGLPAPRILDVIAETRPWDHVAFHLAPWRGVLDLSPMVQWLATHLPPTFADLPRPFAAGVSARVNGVETPFLLREGPLPLAVAASCAIPWLFASPLSGPEGAWRDGAWADRLMYAPWAAWRGDQEVIVHAVARSRGIELPLPAAVRVIRTPRSGASLWNLGDVRGQAEEARGVARRVLGASPG